MNIVKESKKDITCSKSYTEAVKHIQAAIDSLGAVAASDKIAKESIANLGVVALDLNSNKK